LDEISEDDSESKMNPSEKHNKINDIKVRRISPKLRKNN